MSGHWYTADGRAAHNEGPRGTATTLREARKLGLRPSVTTIIKDVIARPGLDRWIRQQWLLAALTLPRLEGESEQDFAERAIADADEHSKNARDKGTEIHGAIERGEGPHAAGFARMLGETQLTVAWHEHTIAGPDYGGTADLLLTDAIGQTILVDLKGQEWADGKKPRIYDEWSWQLAAYAEIIKPQACASIVFDRNDPERWHVHNWSALDIENGWHIFRCAKEIWKRQKRYDPCLTK